MLLAALVCSLLLVAAAFASAATRAVTRAGRAEAATAARHRFLTAIDRRGAAHPAAVVNHTFEALLGRLPPDTGRHTLRPDARLVDDLGLTPEDVEDVALLVAARCEARLPRGRDLDSLHRDVVTAADLVDYVAAFMGGPAAGRRAA